ncbi:hypothetical protein GTY75_09245 [Streptomyces sp. SID8381]|uniref:hypothetical protein n=1 Tax=unclassified Streptomyces TaxID=2593676 RepID=UPI000372B3A6|nr:MULTISPECIES: hypothetical protein [unclassified Streptomyces]MYX26852.1 hypothetical protein [Streptomyces sp. SID8381]
MLVPASSATRLARCLDGEAPAPHDSQTLRAVLAAAALAPAPSISETAANRVESNCLAELRRLRAARRAASADAGSRDGLAARGSAVVITTPDGRRIRAASSIEAVDERTVLDDIEQAKQDDRTQGHM